MIVPAGNGGDTRLSVPFPARAASPPCGSKRRTLPRNYCALQQRARRGIEEGPLPFIFPLHLPPNSRRFFIRPSSGLSFPVIAIFLFSPSPSLLSVFPNFSSSLEFPLRSLFSFKYKIASKERKGENTLLCLVVFLERWVMIKERKKKVEKFVYSEYVVKRCFRSARDRGSASTEFPRIIYLCNVSTM